MEVGPSIKFVKADDTVTGGVGGGDFEDIENGASTDLLSVNESLLFRFPHNIDSTSSSIDLSKPTVSKPHHWESPLILPHSRTKSTSLQLIAETGLSFTI